jgi:hypothetical protein
VNRTLFQASPIAHVEDSELAAEAAMITLDVRPKLVSADALIVGPLRTIRSRQSRKIADESK